MSATTGRQEASSKNMRLLLNWLLSAIGLLIVSYLLPGFHVSGFGAALIAALVIGLVNATLGLFLKVITLPLTILTLGIFWWVINALMLLLASAILSPRFVVTGFWPAFLGAIVLSLINAVLRALSRDVEKA
jgi:putative membrane protein